MGELGQGGGQELHQLRAHVLIPKQEAKGTLGMAQAFEDPHCHTSCNIGRSHNPSPTILPTGYQVFKHKSLCDHFHSYPRIA